MEVQGPGIGGFASASNCDSSAQSIEKSCEEPVGFGGGGMLFEACIGHGNFLRFYSNYRFLVMQVI